MGYSRNNPSPRYHQLVDLYREMHMTGEAARRLPPEQVFPGRSLLIHAVAIKEWVDRFEARTILDYGAGKGMQYEWRDLVLSDGRKVQNLQHFWGVESIVRYDPAYLPFSRVPEGRFDAVICTDVLEHCHDADVPWILDELFGYAHKFVFGNIACHPAKAKLPNGENAHCTIRPETWWHERLAKAGRRHPGVRYRFVLERKYRNLIGLKQRRRQVVEG
jgi:hypothetical protein